MEAADLPQQEQYSPVSQPSIESAYSTTTDFEKSLSASLDTTCVPKDTQDTDVSDVLERVLETPETNTDQVQDQLLFESVKSEVESLQSQTNLPVVLQSEADEIAKIAADTQSAADDFQKDMLESGFKKVLENSLSLTSTEPHSSSINNSISAPVNQNINDVITSSTLDESVVRSESFNSAGIWQTVQANATTTVPGKEYYPYVLICLIEMLLTIDQRKQSLPFFTLRLNTLPTFSVPHQSYNTDPILLYSITSNYYECSVQAYLF